MPDWEYSSSVQVVTLAAGSEVDDLGDLDEFVHRAINLQPGRGVELVSHDLSTLGDGRYLLTMLFRRAA